MPGSVQSAASTSDQLPYKCLNLHICKEHQDALKYVDKSKDQATFQIDNGNANTLDDEIKNCVHSFCIASTEAWWRFFF